MKHERIRKARTSAEIRDYATRRVKGGKKSGKRVLGWLDVYEEALQYALPGRSVHAERVKLNVLLKPFEGQFPDEIVRDLRDFVEGILKDIEENFRQDPKTMSIALEAAKRYEAIAMPRLTSQKVEEDPNKNRSMIRGKKGAGYDDDLPEGTEDE